MMDAISIKEGGRAVKESIEESLKHRVTYDELLRAAISNNVKLANNVKKSKTLIYQEIYIEVQRGNKCILGAIIDTIKDSYRCASAFQSYEEEDFLIFEE